MLKRIWLFLATNLAVLVLLNIVLLIVERVFWVPLTWNIYIIIISVVFWFWWAFISLFLSKWLAKRAYNIVLVSQSNLWELDEKEKIVYNIVEKLSLEYKIKMPEVWFYLSDDANAFATWYSKNNSLVAVSTKLLDIMDKNEIEWVIGHEMAHILNGDMITMTLLQWIVNTFVIFLSRTIANIVSQLVDEKLSWLVYFITTIALEIIFWILASLIVMWFSRKREFRADEWSVKFLWKERMVSALKALKRMEDFAPSNKNNYSTMQISTKTEWGFKRFFMSHPAIDERIKNLESKF